MTEKKNGKANKKRKRQTFFLATFCLGIFFSGCDAIVLESLTTEPWEFDKSENDEHKNSLCRIEQTKKTATGVLRHSGGGTVFFHVFQFRRKGRMAGAVSYSLRWKKVTKKNS